MALVTEGRLRVAMVAPAFRIISTAALVWEELFSLSKSKSFAVRDLP